MVRMKWTRRRGLTITELLVLAGGVIIVVAIVMMLFAPICGGRRPDAMRVKNQVQIQMIHKAHLVHAEESGSAGSNDVSADDPSPQTTGIDDLMRDFALHVPGPPEAQTTASIYAWMIMQNFYDPQMLISPLEKSERVVEHHAYDYECYDPVNGVHWDPGFKADLATVAHTSYAHVVPIGARCRGVATFDPDVAVFGDRGPAGGVADPASITIDERGAWLGSVCWADNHATVERSMTPRTADDNLFAVDAGFDGADDILSFVAAMRDGVPVLQHD